MDSEKWMEHFVERTDKRFDSLENKLDTLLKFKWQIIGGSAAVSILITVGFQFLTKT